MGGPLFAAGLRFVQDQVQQFTRAGLPVYLRAKEFDDSGQVYVSLGFQFSPTGGQAAGFSDILIQPPPEVSEVSMHNIGLNQTRLRFGSRIFRISHSFVLQQMNDNLFTDPWQVWNNNFLIGIVYDNRLFSLVDVTHSDAAGDIIWWKLVCNATDTIVSEVPNGSS